MSLIKSSVAAAILSRCGHHRNDDHAQREYDQTYVLGLLRLDSPEQLFVGASCASSRGEWQRLSERVLGRCCYMAGGGPDWPDEAKWTAGRGLVM
jgi:hypothetical protein